MEWVLVAALFIAKLAFWGACLFVPVLIYRNFRPSSSAKRKTTPPGHLSPRPMLTESYDSSSVSTSSSYGGCADSTRANEAGQGEEGGRCEPEDNDAGSDSDNCDSGGDGGGGD